MCRIPSWAITKLRLPGMVPISISIHACRARVTAITATA